jgi:hypothetical protein
LALVLGRDHLRELDHGRQAKPAVAEWLDDLRVSLEELSRRLAVLGGARGEAQLAVQEVEEARMAELDPEPPLIEIGKGDEEVSHCGVLAAE